MNKTPDQQRSGGRGSSNRLSLSQRAAIYKTGFRFIADKYLYAPVCRNTAGWATTENVIGVKTMPGFEYGVPVLTSLGVARS